MTRKGSEPSVAATKRELDKASAALDQPGSGSLANLECRVGDLQVRFISTPARTLADIEARLASIRTMVEAAGPPGYLLDVVNATLDDVRVLRAKGKGAGEAEGDGY